MTGFTPPAWYQPFLTQFGLKASLGTLHSFVAGTPDLPKPLYHDLEMTSPWTNPVPLDANGAAPEYFMESGFYLFVVKDSSGNVIITRDNVCASSLDGKVLVDDGDTISTYLADKFLDSDTVTWDVVDDDEKGRQLKATAIAPSSGGITDLLPPAQMSSTVDSGTARLNWAGASNELVKADGTTILRSSVESNLGTPSADDLVLASTTSGQRYWRAAGGSGTGYLPLAGGTMTAAAAIAWPSGTSAAADHITLIDTGAHADFRPSGIDIGGGSTLGQLSMTVSAGSEKISIFNIAGTKYFSIEPSSFQMNYLGSYLRMSHIYKAFLAQKSGYTTGEYVLISWDKDTDSHLGGSLDIWNGGLKIAGTQVIGSDRSGSFTALSSQAGVTQWAQFTNPERIQGVQYTKTATTTISGTTVETSLINGGVAAGGWAGITVPPGRLNIAGLLSDLKLKGAISSSGTTLATWRIRVNGAVVATNAVSRNWGTSYWRIEGNGTTRTVGTSGTRQWDIGLYANADNVNNATSYYDLGWLGTLDLTTHATLDVTVQPASTAMVITCSTAFVKHS